eukprot:15475637-Alexandrium_andersonii.AAC.1
MPPGAPGAIAILGRWGGLGSLAKEELVGDADVHLSPFASGGRPIDGLAEGVEVISGGPVTNSDESKE